MINKITFFFFLTTFFFFLNPVNSQEEPAKNSYSLKNPKGNFFLFWGYNRETYANSDIHVKGSNYDFTIHDVPAHDMPEEFSFAVYFDPQKITIPQFNARGGYYISDNWVVSAGWDHMKYQTIDGAEVAISGTIDQSASYTYGGTYSNEPITMNHDSLVRMEHSDGLNLIQFNLERHDLLWINQKEKMALESVLGAGINFPMPWTNAKIFGKANDDRPHFTGVGLSVFAGIKFFFFKRFFLQGIGQTGYMTLPGIVITPKGGSERASQKIFYGEAMVVLGYSFRLY